MENKIVDLKNTQILSKRYIKDNMDKVAAANQKMLVNIAILYMVVICLYNIIVPIFFAEWGVNWIYQVSLVIHILVLTLILLRYRKRPRAEKEIRWVSALFQLYCMAFVLVVSILPFEFEQPATYYVPVMIGFSALFIYTLRMSVALVLVESVGLILCSFLFKSSEVASVNCFSCLLGAFVALFVANILYTNRNAESQHRKELRKIGNTDKLTGIANRAATETACSDFIHSNKMSKYALMLLDVDHFKSVNDTYGHQTGDELLVKFAKVVKEAAGPLNIVGRMGGDEFLVFVKNWEKEEELDDIANQVIRHTLKMPLPDDRVNISCSVGICALGEDDWMEYDELFSCADQALYQVKENGRNGKAYYDLDLLG